MENGRQKKALIVLISLLVLFSIFTLYLTQRYPYKERRATVRVDQEGYFLDSMVFSSVYTALNSNGYLANYTTNPQFEPEDYIEILEIIPNGKDDIVIYLIKNNHSNVYFFGWIKYEIGFPGGMGDFGQAGEILHDEMVRILTVINFEDLINDIEITSDEFFLFSGDEFNEVAFFTFFTIIVIFMFIMIYKNGLLLDKIFDKELYITERDGLILLFLGMVPFFVMLNELRNIVTGGYLEMLSCCAIGLVVAVTFIFSGLHLLLRNKKDYEFHF
jgi:hypothetical protein